MVIKYSEHIHGFTGILENININRAISPLQLSWPSKTACSWVLSPIVSDLSRGSDLIHRLLFPEVPLARYISWPQVRRLGSR